MGLIDNRDAQFMLLAAFIVGIGLVITTVMLNSIIFESNLAIDAGNDPSKNEIANLLEITRDEMRNAYRNANGTDNSSKIENFTKQINNFSENLPLIYARHGEGINITWDISNWNDTIRANFTKNGMAGGEPDWAVVQNVNNVSIFEFSNVGVDDYFLINVTNSSGRIWSMNFSEIDNVTITNKTGGNFSTSVTYSFLNILDPTFEFNTSTSGETYSINFVNGDNAWGNYAIEGQHATYGNQFTRQRHYVLNSTVSLSTSRMRANITIPVTVPW